MEKLKNYTSGIAVERSIAYIEMKLAANSAHQVLKEYDKAGQISSICFALMIDGEELYYKLPAQIEQCKIVLEADLSPKAREETRKRVLEQASRTAWKIISDWVEVQFAMIKLRQTKFEQVMMPYLYNPATKKTLFEIFEGKKNYKALLEAPKERK
jgi:hypothetical protein